MLAKIIKNLRSHINLVTVLFCLVMVYLIACLVNSHIKKSHTIYEVSSSDISDSIQGTGVIIRQEKVYKTGQDGYITSYLSDGDRVKTGGKVYAIDQTGEIQKKVNSLIESEENESAIEVTKVSDDLDTFIEGYSDSDFYMVTETENELERDIMSYTGTILSKNLKKLKKEFKNDKYTEVKSPTAGLVSYSCDGLENLTEDTISKKVFKEKAHMEDLHTKDAVSQGTNVFRLTTSQNWSIIIPLAEDDYNHIKSLWEERIEGKKDRFRSVKKTNGKRKYSEKDIAAMTFYTYIDIVIQKDELSLSVPYECFEKDGQGYVKLSMSNYVQRYLNQRYLSVKIVLAQGSGLKIPTSALVEKTAFRIPAEYLCKGANSSEANHVLLVYETKDGEKKNKAVEVYTFNRSNTTNSSDGDDDDDETDTNAMVSIMSDQLSEGDYIQKEGSDDTYPLGRVVSGYGVYTVNSGYCVFNYVNITERNEDYCIASEDDSQLQLYDRIILNSDSVEENEIIY